MRAPRLQRPPAVATRATTCRCSPIASRACVRSFEKRIYIPLPEAPARREMSLIHLGDTPHEMLSGDFDKLAEHTEGCVCDAIRRPRHGMRGCHRAVAATPHRRSFSGSDISVLVREALMEPLRKCRQAKFFMPITTEDGRRMVSVRMALWAAVVRGRRACECRRRHLPSLPQLTPVFKPEFGHGCSHWADETTVRPKRSVCPGCGALAMTLYDLETHELHVPKISVVRAPVLYGTCASTERCHASCHMLAMCPSQEDIIAVLKRSKPTVAVSELGRFIAWTEEFGVEGS